MRPITLRARPFYLQIVVWLLAVGLFATSAWPQGGQPIADDVVKELVRATLLQYFDPASVFEISVSGAVASGDVVSVADLLIAGKPAVLLGFRAEFLAHLKGLDVEMRPLATQQPKLRGAKQVTVVARSTAKAVEDGLARASASIIHPTVHFEAGQFDIAATLRRQDKLYPIQAQGTLVVDSRQRVNVSIIRMLVSGTQAPDNVIAQELSKVNPILDLSSWPLNLHIQRVTLHKDAAEVLITNAK